MLSKNYAKLIYSLKKKKFRQKYNLFAVEGIKSVTEVLKSEYKIDSLFYTKGNWDDFDVKSNQISESDLRKISSLQTPNEVIAICEIPKKSVFIKEEGLTLVLDDIRDPGNLGTIIRLADWFGIPQVVCSNESVDLYNPKCIQACMGSFLSVDVFYEDLNEVLLNSNIPVVGTFMNGKNLYQVELPENAFLVMGNEANGISEKVEKLITKKLSIPSFNEKQIAESLNIAMATALFLGEFKSRAFSSKIE